MALKKMDKNTSSTRTQILNYLKTSDGLTVDALAEKLSISPMGVRQHLSLLEKDGLTRRDQFRLPVGRPCYVYSLTEKADSVFPKTYEAFAREILNDCRGLYGNEKVDLIFKRRRERAYGEWKDLVSQENLFDRVKALAKKLNEIGFLANFQKKNGQIILTGYNCPIYKIAKEYPELCKNDHQLYVDLLKAGVEQITSIARGDRQCKFVISESAVLNNADKSW